MAEADNSAKDFAESQASFSVAAPLVNRFQIVLSGPIARIAFLEQSVDGSATWGRSAVTMVMSDIVALHATLGALLATHAKSEAGDVGDVI